MISSQAGTVLSVVHLFRSLRTCNNNGGTTCGEEGVSGEAQWYRNPIKTMAIRKVDGTKRESALAICMAWQDHALQNCGKRKECLKTPEIFIHHLTGRTEPFFPPIKLAHFLVAKQERDEEEERALAALLQGALAT
jgi:hypothetical protein